MDYHNNYSGKVKFGLLAMILLASVTDKINATICRKRIVAKDPVVANAKQKVEEIHVLSLQNIKSVSNKFCSWEFSSPDNFLLNIHFINFTSPKRGSDCSGCFAYIKKKFSENNRVDVSEPYCGQSQLPGIRVNGTVEIELHCNVNHTNSSNLAMAILLEATTENCGGMFNDSYLALPILYNATKETAIRVMHCVWYFDFKEDLDLNIIVSQFTLPHDYSKGCNNRYLEIRTWDDNGQVTYFRRECKARNYQLPTNFTSSAGKHFAVTVHSKSRRGNDELVSALCFPTTTGYSNAYLEVNDIVQAPFKASIQPIQPAKRLSELLFLKTKSKNQLFVVLSNLTEICDHGSLQIWSNFASGFGSNSELCQKNSTISNTIFNAQSSFVVYYQVTRSTVKYFHIVSFASNKGCGGAYHSTQGQSMLVKSPNYGRGRKYPVNSDCRWLFFDNNKTEFDVDVKEMDLETCRNCNCDYFSVIHVAELRPNSAFYKMCRIPMEDYVVKSPMVLFFHSDSSIQKKGFLVNITTLKACGDDFYLLPGETIELVSPRYGKGAYPPNYFCQWSILTTDITGINISVVEMDLDPLGCYFDYYDYVEVFQGVYQNITLLRKICEKPSTNIVLNGSSTIRFHSDGNEAGRGFKMIIQAIPGMIPITTELPTTLRDYTPSLPATSTNASIITEGLSNKSKALTTTQPLKSSSKCCMTTTQNVKTKYKYTKFSIHLNSARSNKDNSGNQEIKRIVGIVIPVVVIIFAAAFAGFYIYRRKVHYGSTKEDQHKVKERLRKRQSSTLPLVDLENRRKSSCHNSSLPYIIENSCYSNTSVKQSNLESDNPYYSSNDTCIVNPYYDNHSDKAASAVYASIDRNEEQFYSVIHGKKEETDYAYAASLEVQTASENPQFTEDNQYATIGDYHAM